MEAFWNTKQIYVFEIIRVLNTKQTRLGLVVNLSLNLIGYFNGYILDRFGTWIYRILPIIFKCVAYILLMISTLSTSYLLYPFSILTSLSGVSLIVSSFQIANFNTYSTESFIINIDVVVKAPN